eukprot:30773-Pelagococcus_subviridis.AAC.3
MIRGTSARRVWSAPVVPGRVHRADRARHARVVLDVEIARTRAARRVRFRPVVARRVHRAVRARHARVRDDALVSRATRVRALVHLRGDRVRIMRRRAADDS